MALVASFSGAFHYVIVGRLYKNTSTNSAILLTFYAGFGGLIVILPAMFLDINQNIFSKNITEMSTTTWVALSGVAVQGLLGFLACNLAIKRIKPVFVSFVGVSEIVMAYISQIVIFSTVPNTTGIVGSIVILITICVVSFEETVLEKLPGWIQKIF